MPTTLADEATAVLADVALQRPPLHEATVKVSDSLSSSGDSPFTVIPVLQESAVQERGWLTDSQFVDGLAIGGVLPAPLVIFATFVGYVAGGPAGAMTVGVFLPAFLFPILLHRWLVAIANNPRVRPFLLGVAAAVVGLIAAVGVRIVETGVVDVPTALLALGAFGALLRFHSKLTVLWVVLSCGVIGAALQLTVL